MTKPVHPFTHHQARWSNALKNLSSAHESAKNAAVGHIHQRVTIAAERADMDSNDVGTFWYHERPHISIQPGKTADLEYGTLDQAPRATIRNAARRADREAVKIYHNNLWRGIGL